MKKLQNEHHELREHLDSARSRILHQNERIEKLDKRRAVLRERLDTAHEHVATQNGRLDRLESTLAVIDTALRRRRLRDHERSAAEPNRLVILDDVFPHLASGFRLAEYNEYLRRWPDTTIYTTANYRILKDERGFGQVLNTYDEVYPSLSRNVKLFDGDVDLSDSLVYTLFVNNADFFLNAIHAYDVPFVTTIYPGGGLQLKNEDSDRKLRRICTSPNLRKIIVSQAVVRDYLLENSFSNEETIEFIYGGVYQASFLAAHDLSKQIYKADKETFDVCFVAHKYMERGIDKGYDTFIEVARRLCAMHPDVRIHIVGSFDETDIEVADFKERITFYGSRPSEFFAQFYQRMDAILSPNVPFVLAPGAFDIFPIGCCIEAGSCGVGVFCTDPLKQNVAFEEGQEIEIVPSEVGEIVDRLGHYHDAPDELRRLSERGREAFRRTFDLEAQMKPRFELFEQTADLTSREPK